MSAAISPGLVDLRFSYKKIFKTARRKGGQRFTSTITVLKQIEEYR